MEDCAVDCLVTEPYVDSIAAMLESGNVFQTQNTYAPHFATKCGAVTKIVLRQSTTLGLRSRQLEKIWDECSDVLEVESPVFMI